MRSSAASDVYKRQDKRYRNVKKIKYKEKEIENLLTKYDIILPYIATGLSLEEGYKKAHIAQDWEELKKVIKEVSPEYYEIALKIFNGYEFYPFNMFIAKKEIIDGYCEWLFKILLELEKRIKISTDPYQACLLYTSPSPRDGLLSRMPSSA